MSLRFLSKPRQWFAVAVLNFALAGLAGIVLRWAFVHEIPFLDYRNLVHGHSHTAMIGWGYLAILAILMAEWQSSFRDTKLFTVLFVINEISVIGMYVTFPIYGYQGIPIFFTSVHLILSYLLAYYFLRALRKSRSYGWPVRFIKSAFFFQILSTLGIWLLPVIILLGERHSAVYHMAVQFFLHFQFNGWYIFACLGLFLKLLDRHRIKPSPQFMTGFHHLLFGSCLLTYALAITWSQPIQAIFWINSLGVIIQAAALWYLWQSLWPKRHRIQALIRRYGSQLIFFSGVAFALKIIVQALVVLPAIAVIAYTIKNFVVGFVHLILLGILSTYLLGHATTYQWLDYRQRSFRVGRRLFLWGLIMTELLLFVQGIILWMGQGFIPNYYLMLLALSVLLWTGIFLITFKLIQGTFSVKKLKTEEMQVST